MSNLVMWNLIIGFLMPNLVAVIQNPRFSSTQRSVITLASAVVGGAVTAYFNGDFNFEDIVGSILVTGVAAITFYKGFWKPTGVATAIENATSKTPPTVEQAHPDDAPRDERGHIEPMYAVLLVILVVILFLLLAPRF